MLAGGGGKRQMGTGRWDSLGLKDGTYGDCIREETDGDRGMGLMTTRLTDVASSPVNWL